MSIAARPRAKFMQAEGFDDGPLLRHCGQVLRDKRRALRRACTTPQDAHHWSQVGVALRLGTSKDTVSALERGARWPYFDRVLLYAFLVQVPYAQLFPDAPESPEACLTRRILAAPPYVHDLMHSILDMQCPARLVSDVDAS